MAKDNTETKKCPACSYGVTTAREQLEGLVGLLLLAADGAGSGRSHPYFEDLERLVGLPHGPAGKDLLDLAAGLAEPYQPFLGSYCGMARYKATRRVIQAAGLDPDRWGICPACGGDGCVPQTGTQAEDAK